MCTLKTRTDRDENASTTGGFHCCTTGNDTTKRIEYDESDIGNSTQRPCPSYRMRVLRYVRSRIVKISFSNLCDQLFQTTVIICTPIYRVDMYAVGHSRVIWAHAVVCVCALVQSKSFWSAVIRAGHLPFSRILQSQRSIQYGLSFMVFPLALLLLLPLDSIYANGNAKIDFFYLKYGVIGSATVSPLALCSFLICGVV